MCTPAHPVASQCSISKAAAPSSCSERLLRQAHCPSVSGWLARPPKSPGPDEMAAPVRRVPLTSTRCGGSLLITTCDGVTNCRFASKCSLSATEKGPYIEYSRCSRLVCSVGKRCRTIVCAASSRLASPASTRRRRASCSCLRCLCSSSSAF